MSDRIYVTYVPIVSGGTPFFHARIHYERTDASGNVIDHKTLEGAPEIQNLPMQDKINATLEEFFIPDFGPSRFGHIVTSENLGAPLALPTGPYETIAVADDLSSSWNSMQQFALTFTNLGYAYRGITQNSNTFASAALKAGDLPGAFGIATYSDGSFIWYTALGLNEPLKPPIGFGSSWTPVEGLQFSSITEQDGSKTSSTELLSSSSGGVTKASIHTTLDDVIDKVETVESNGAKTVVTFDQDNSKSWSVERTGYSPNAGVGGQPLYSVEVGDNGAISSFLWQGHALAAGDIGTIFGSNLGRLLGGNSLAGQVAAGTLIGAIGHEIGAVHTDPLHTPWQLTDGFDAFSLGTSITGAVGAYFGSYLAGQIVTAHYQTGAIGGSTYSARCAARRAVASTQRHVAKTRRPVAFMQRCRPNSLMRSIRAYSRGTILRLPEPGLAA